MCVRLTYSNEAPTISRAKKCPRNTPAFLPPLEAQELADAPRFGAMVTDNTESADGARNGQSLLATFFRCGPVKTSADFGAQGEYPTHPELLDELAISFVASGWDIKGLCEPSCSHKTYRQSSSVSPEQYRADAGIACCPWLAHSLGFEVIRDQISPSAVCSTAPCTARVSSRRNLPIFGKRSRWCPPLPIRSKKTPATKSIDVVSTRSGSGPCRRRK